MIHMDVQGTDNCGWPMDFRAGPLIKNTLRLYYKVQKIVLIPKAIPAESLNLIRSYQTDANAVLK